MPRSRQAKQSTSFSIADLDAARASIRNQYGRPSATRSKYDGYIKRGKAFLAELTSQRRRDNVQDDVDTDLLAAAFDDPPNKYSALALEYFLTHECCEEAKGKDTATGIQGAFCDYWDYMGDGRYGGDYQYHAETDEVYGCPARAPPFRNMLKMVNKRSKTEGTRHHAEAIDIHAMKQTIDWSEAQYLSDKLTTAPQNEKEKNLAFKHAMVRAMFTLAFILWTRNSELVALRIGDIERDCIGARPNCKPHTKVRLHHRKGWQNKSDASGQEGVSYELHPRPDIPQIDAEAYVKRYLAYREMVIGRSLHQDELLFPYISRNGTVHLNRPMTLNQVQTLINMFTSSAGLTKHYTTHCFRRGGAQYRFIYAPIRWSLQAVRWWGGWVEGDSVDTLSKYLLDSLQKHEKNYSDQLLVGADEPRTSVGGARLATVDDIRAFGYTLTSAFQAAEVKVVSPAPSPPTVPVYMAPGAPYLGPIMVPTCPTSYHFIASPPGPSSSDTTSITSISSSDPSLTLNMDALNLNSPTASSDSSSDSEYTSDSGTGSSGTSFSGDLGLVRIPDLPHRGEGIWYEAVKQWTKVDPQIGLALCDWPESWSKGKMKNKVAMKLRSRKVVWEEYQRLGGTSQAFRERHPYADSVPFSRLVRIINERNGVIVHRRRRRSTQNRPQSPEQ